MTAVSDDMVELKPCPFCGEKPFITEDNGAHYFTIWCENIACHVGCECTEVEKSDVIERWNTRTPAALEGSVAVPTDADKIALDTAQRIESLPNNLNETQKTARIQLLVLDAIKAVSRKDRGGAAE